jgi:diguanylate cyclase (GGDEF)-like protein
LTLALALSYRLSLTRQKLFEAQQVALDNEIKLRETQASAMKMVQQANQELELKVRERTAKLEEALTELHISHEKLKEHSTRDGLTGLRNRPYFDELFMREWRRVQREKGSLALILMDLDYFKAINDDYGHLAGDICLKRVADLIRRSIHRPGDEVARYGGEEFALLLPMTSGEGALKIAEDIRLLVDSLTVKIEDHSLNPTLSCGVAVLEPNDQIAHLSLLKMADIALYQAKERGRNQTVMFSGDLRSPQPDS